MGARQAFLDAVDDYLQPYISRREQARALQAAVDATRVQITVDSAFTSVHAEFPQSPGQELFVMFEDARSSQPTRVRAFRQVPAPGTAAAGTGRAATASRGARLETVRGAEAEQPCLHRRLPDAFLEAFPTTARSAGGDAAAV